MMGPMTAEIPFENARPENAIPAYSGLFPAHSAAAFGHVEENPPDYARWSASVSDEQITVTHQTPEYDSEDVQVYSRVCEAPE